LNEKVEKLNKHENSELLNDPVFQRFYQTHDKFLDSYIFSNLPFIKDINFEDPEF